MRTDGASSRIDDICVDVGASLRTAMTAIGRGAIDLGIVISNGLPVGTVTDGDVRRALLAGHGLDDAVGPIANRSFVAVGENADRAHVLDLMSARHISAIPVISDDGQVVGVHVLREMIGGQRRSESAVLMAGGRGVRLRPLTDQVPKPMLKVAGRPILERIVLHLVGSGIRRIYVAVNYRADQIEEHFGDGRDLGCDIEYLREDPDRPLGTAGALGLLPRGERDMGESYLVMNADLVTQFEVGRMLDDHQASGALATVGVQEYGHAVPFGVVEADGGRVTSLVEKPRATWTVNAGVYVISDAAVDRIPSEREYPMTELLGQLLLDGALVRSHDLGADWTDVGRPADLAVARGVR